MTTIQALHEIVGKDCVKTDELLKNHTAIKMGGNASWYIIVSTLDALKKVVAVAYTQKLPVVILGSGTSFIPPDAGVQGFVIRNNCRGITIASKDGEDTLVSAESGAMTNQLVRFCMDNGLSGIEYAMGLPGTIGGAITMNAMYPKEKAFVSENLDHAYLLTADGLEKKVTREYFQFAINKSILQENKEILLRVVFRLTTAPKEDIQEKGKEALLYRVSTQPKGHITGYTYRNIDAFEDFEKGSTFAKAEGNVWFFQDNPRYILQNGNGSVAELASLEKYMNHFLAEQNVNSEYTIKVTGD